MSAYETKKVEFKSEFCENAFFAEVSFAEEGVVRGFSKYNMVCKICFRQKESLMKKARHKKILSLISEFNIDRQEVLLDYLNNMILQQVSFDFSKLPFVLFLVLYFLAIIYFSAISVSFSHRTPPGKDHIDGTFEDDLVCYIRYFALCSAFILFICTFEHLL